MPAVRTSPASFVACSDIHLSARPPLARSGEKDWLKTQAGVLDQVTRLCAKHGCPLVIAGDVFDRWNAPPAVINVAIKAFKKATLGVYAVPGQHDLPNHVYQDIKKSAYWTLVESDAVMNLPYGAVCDIGHLRLHGFPWGVDLQESGYAPEPHDLIQDVAVVHRYLWKKGTGHPQARDEDRVRESLDVLKCFDVSVFGDNHTPFVHAGDGYTIINCGGLQRRTVAERDHRPRAWLVRGDNSCEPLYLDTSGDVMLDPGQVAEDIWHGELDDFLAEVGNLYDAAADFAGVMRRMADNPDISPGARELISRALKAGKK